MGRWCLALALVLLLAPPARAAEVETVRICYAIYKGVSCHHEARYAASAAEVNDLSIARAGPGRFVLRDRVAVTAGAGCSARPDGAVTCQASVLNVDLGDVDDRAQVLADTGLVAVRGGPGADVLTLADVTNPLAGSGMLDGGDGDDRLSGALLSGGDGADTLVGTDGPDRLDGGGGPDAVSGGPGDDSITGDGGSTTGFGPGAAVPAPDVLDGGPGTDGLGYGGHRVPVTVDLSAPTAGAAGEHDRITGFENAFGGAADDVLIGDAGPNELHGLYGRNTIAGGDGDDTLESYDSGVIDGGPGDDRVTGGNGGDRLMGGPGSDRLDGRGGGDGSYGGPGDDRLYADDSMRADEVLACDEGRDEIRGSTGALLGRDCETVSGTPVYPRAGARGRLIFTIPDARRLRRGIVDLRIRGRRRSFAAGRFAGGRRTARAVVVVPRAVRRLRRPLPVAVRIRARTPWGRHVVRWTIDLPR